MKSDFLAAPILRNLTAEWEPRSFTLTRRGTRQIVSSVGPEPAEFFVQHLWVKAFYLKGIPVRPLVSLILAFLLLAIGIAQRKVFFGPSFLGPSMEWHDYSTGWRIRAGEIRRELTNSTAEYRQSLNQVSKSILASLETELRAWRTETTEASRQAREGFAEAVSEWRVWTMAMEKRLKEARPNWHTLRAYFRQDIEQLKPIAKQEVERDS